MCQLGGSNPELLAKAAKIVERYGYDEININCGALASAYRSLGCAPVAPLPLSRAWRHPHCSNVGCPGMHLPLQRKRSAARFTAPLHSIFAMLAGCPSDRVAGAGCFGAALMLRPELVAQCCKAMCEAVTTPITVKCRLGERCGSLWVELRAAYFAHCLALAILHCMPSTCNSAAWCPSRLPRRRGRF